MRYLASSLFLVAVVVLSGCGGPSDTLARRPITGKVTLAGMPLDQGIISFDPIGKGTSAGASILNGAYSIPESAGLPAGNYVVRISSPVGGAPTPEFPGESDQVAKERIPDEFNSQSKLKAEVTANGKNTFDFEIPKAAQ